MRMGSVRYEAGAIVRRMGKRSVLRCRTGIGLPHSLLSLLSCRSFCYEKHGDPLVNDPLFDTRAGLLSFPKSSIRSRIMCENEMSTTIED